MQSTAVATSPATISACLGGYLGSLFAQRMLSFMSAWTSDIACTVHLPSREYRSAANEDDANEGRRRQRAVRRRRLRRRVVDRVHDEGVVLRARLHRRGGRGDDGRGRGPAHRARVAVVGSRRRGS